MITIIVEPEQEWEILPRFSFQTAHFGVKSATAGSIILYVALHNMFWGKIRESSQSVPFGDRFFAVRNSIYSSISKTILRSLLQPKSWSTRNTVSNIDHFPREIIGPTNLTISSSLTPRNLSLSNLETITIDSIGFFRSAEFTAIESSVF